MTSLRRKIIEHRKYFQRKGYDANNPQVLHMKTDDLIESFVWAFADGEYEDDMEYAKDTAREIVLMLKAPQIRWYA